MELTINNIIQLLLEKHKTQTLIYSDKYKFRNTKKYEAKNNDYIISAIVELKDMYSRQGVDNKHAINNLSDLVLEYCSNLYAFGAEISLCKQWLSLYAGLSYFRKDYFDAAVFAVIAEEFAIVKMIPDEMLNSRQTPEQVFWKLLEKPLRYPLTSDIHAYQGIFKEYCKMLKDIPAGDSKSLDNSFKNIAQYYFEDGWTNKYEFKQFPLFEPVICSLFSYAVRKGYSPGGFSAKEKIFYRLAIEAKSYADIYSGAYDQLKINKKILL